MRSLKKVLRSSIAWLLAWATTPKGRWTLGLAAVGAVLGLFTGGLGLALMGTAIGLKGWAVLGGLFGLVGNCVGGIRRDRMRT
ncbi:hypothetical protein LFADAHJC_LOCUS2605 [Methylorubrum extorquens]